MARLTATVSLQVRLPEGLRRKLVQEADQNARSLNGEIVWRLGQSFGTVGAALASSNEVALTSKRGGRRKRGFQKNRSRM